MFQVGDLGCSAVFSSIVVLPSAYSNALTVGSHCSVSHTKNYCAGNLCCESKVLFEVFSSFFVSAYFLHGNSVR